MTDRIEPARSAERWTNALQRMAQDRARGDEPGSLGSWYEDVIGETDAERVEFIALNNAALPDSDSRKITRETVRAILSARTAYPLGSASHRELIQIAAALASLLPPDQQTPDLDTAYAAYLPPE